MSVSMNTSGLGAEELKQQQVESSCRAIVERLQRDERAVAVFNYMGVDLGAEKTATEIFMDLYNCLYSGSANVEPLSRRRLEHLCCPSLWTHSCTTILMEMS